MKKNKKTLKNKENLAYEDALIYCRVSSVTQETDGSGLQSQEHRCRDYARNKGYDVEKVFFDSVSGGGDFMKRPAMRELLSYIDKHVEKNYVVIFDDLKRFARDTEFHFKLRSAFKARSVKPECLNYNFDDSPEGIFVETIFAAQGQLEKDQNRRQVIQKMNARLEDGYWPFFPPPGYKAKRISGHGKVLHIDNPTAQIIKDALEGFASNRFPDIIDVHKFLISKGFIKDNGKNHLPRTMAILVRSIYAGYIEYPDWGISRREGKHQALISKECFDKIQAKLSGNIKNKTRQDISNDFPVRGYVCCTECGKLMTSSWCKGRNKSYPYYRCAQKDCSNCEKNINADTLENDLLDLFKKAEPKQQLLDFIKAKLTLKWVKFVKGISSNKESIQSDVMACKEGIKRLVEQMTKAKSQLVIDAIQDQIEEYSKKEKILSGKLYDISDTKINFGTALDLVFGLVKNPYSEWQNGDLAHRRLLISMIFDGNIPYDRKTGFGTAKLHLPSKVFYSNSDSYSLGVDTKQNLTNLFIPLLEFVKRWGIV